MPRCSGRVGDWEWAVIVGLAASPGAIALPQQTQTGRNQLGASWPPLSVCVCLRRCLSPGPRPGTNENPKPQILEIDRTCVCASLPHAALDDNANSPTPPDLHRQSGQTDSLSPHSPWSSHRRATALGPLLRIPHFVALRHLDPHPSPRPAATSRPNTRNKHARRALIPTLDCMHQLPDHRRGA